MLNNEKQTPQLATGADLQVLTSDEYQEEMASRIAEDVFQSEGNAEKVAGVISNFIRSYEKHKPTNEQMQEWLTAEFKNYPTVWKSDEEIQSVASEIISTIKISNKKKESLQEHLDQGKPQASWLANEIEKGASAAGVANVGNYANGIDQALGTANQKNWDAITRMDGFISQSPNLDGFIAEHHHANTFNTDAAAKGSAYRAKVLEPEPGQTYGKNSMDIGIYDGEGKLVRRYQSKYGADADKTSELFEKGDYRGQRKLVPKGYSDSKSTEVIEIDGVSSEPLSKEAAKELQKKAQQKQEAKQYEWNDVNKITIAKQIGKQALVGACINAGMQGSRILARRAWNSFNGKVNPSASEDMQEFFESTIKGAANIGVQVAVSGALIVAAKNGWLGKWLKDTPAGKIANIAYIAMENAKILFKLGKGELTKEEALGAMAQTTTVAIATLSYAANGAALGAYYGVVFGPAGAAVGGFVGGIAGGMAGSKIGEAIYAGGKAIVKTAVSVLKEVASTMTKGIKTVADGVSNFASSVLSFLG